MRRVTWRMWAAILAVVAVDVAAGFWLSGRGDVEVWVYRAGLLAATVVPLAFIAIYTWFGLTGHAKWWRNTLGTALVWAALTLAWIAWPLAWVFWFDGGMLQQGWLAWIEVTAPALSALTWLGMCLVWLSVRSIRDTTTTVTTTSGPAPAVQLEDGDAP